MPGEQSQYNALAAELAVWLRQRYPPGPGRGGAGERRDSTCDIGKPKRHPEQPYPPAGLWGLNETYACSEAEYSAGINFFGPEFPGPEHPDAPQEAARGGKPERDVSPQRAADRLRKKI